MEAVQTLFHRFNALWGTKWRREENNPDFWCSALAEFSFAAVDHAANQAPIDHPSWPPSLAEFLALCRSYRPPLDDLELLPPPKESTPEQRNRVKAMLSKLRSQLDVTP